MVPAVDQAVRILYHLSADPRRRSTLTEVCREVGVYKSKGQAILNTLIAADLVSKDPRDKTYSLGPGVLTISRGFLDQSDLATLGMPYLDDLAQSPGTCAFVAIVRGDHVYVTARRDAPGGMSVTIKVGYQYPLAWGSMGMAIFAFLPDAEREELLHRSPTFFWGDPTGAAAPGATHGPAPPEMRRLLPDLEQCRRLGYATDPGYVQPGLSAASAPLFGAREPSRPLGIVTLAGTIPPEELTARGEAVAATAREISTRLGPLLDELT